MCLAHTACYSWPYITMYDNMFWSGLWSQTFVSLRAVVPHRSVGARTLGMSQGNQDRWVVQMTTLHPTFSLLLLHRPHVWLSAHPLRLQQVTCPRLTRTTQMGVQAPSSVEGETKPPQEPSPHNVWRGEQPWARLRRAEHHSGSDARWGLCPQMRLAKLVFLSIQT